MMRRFSTSVAVAPAALSRGRSVATKKPLSSASTLSQALKLNKSSIPNTLVQELESMKKRGGIAAKKRSLTPRNRKVLVHNLNEVMTVRTGAGSQKRVVSAPSPEDILKIIVKQDSSVTLKTIKEDFTALRIPYLRAVEQLEAKKTGTGSNQKRTRTPPQTALTQQQFNETERRGLVAVFYNILFSSAVLNGELPTVSAIRTELKKQGKSFDPSDIENDLKVLNLKVDAEPNKEKEGEKPSQPSVAPSPAPTPAAPSSNPATPWVDTHPHTSSTTTPTGSAWAEQVTEKRRLLLTHLYKSLMQEKGAPPSPSTLSKMLELPVELISRDYHDLGLFEQAERDANSPAAHSELIQDTIEKLREVEGCTENNTELLRILEGDIQRTNETLSGLDDKFGEEISRLDGRIDSLATSVSSLTKIVDDRETAATRHAPPTPTAPAPPTPPADNNNSLQSILRTLAEFGLLGNGGLVTPASRKKNGTQQETTSDEVRSFIKEQRKQRLAVREESLHDDSQALEPLPKITDVLTPASKQKKKTDLSVDMEVGLGKTPNIGPPLGVLDPALVSRFLLKPPKVTRDIAPEDGSLASEYDWV